MSDQRLGPPSAPSLTDPTLGEFSRLLEIVRRLRGPDGCPWDRQQTQKSLTRYVIEEAYELAEALDSGQQAPIQDELGDFLFQVILQAQVAEDEGFFSMEDVLRGLNEKMIRRHPHVFDAGSTPAKTPEEVALNWQKIKSQEKKSPENFQLAKDLRGFPALLTALKIGHRSEEWKFDWDLPSQVEAKVFEEIREIQEAVLSGDQKAIEEEIGDLLFAVSQWARHLDVEPEAALRKANLKFEKRFVSMLQISGLSQEAFRALSLAEKESLWTQAKKLHKNGQE